MESWIAGVSKREAGQFIKSMIAIRGVHMRPSGETQYHQRLGDIWAKTVVIDTNDEEQGLKGKIGKNIEYR